MVLVKPEREFTSETLTLSKENKIKLATDYAYGQIACRFEIDATNAATGPTFVEDDFDNLIAEIKIKRTGRSFKGPSIKFDLPLRDALIKQHIEKRTKQHRVDPSATGSANYVVEINYDIDFRFDVLNESDISSVLQTGELSELELLVTVGSASDVASANPPTINSVTLYLETLEFAGTAVIGGKEVEINDPNQYTPQDIITSFETKPLEASKISFDANSQEIEILPSNKRFLHSMVIALDNGVKTDDRITHLKVQRVKPIKFDEIERSWKSLTRKTKSEFQQESFVAGVWYKDWVEKYGPAGFSNAGEKGSNLFRLQTDGTVNPAQDEIHIVTDYYG